MDTRAIAPVLGVVLLVGVTVVAATAVGAVIAIDTPEPAPTAAFEAAADETGLVEVRHRGGAAIDPESLRVRIRVDGEPLAEQPPVPFFAARGFESGPTGPFNSATGGEWTAGEAATLRIASTNRPTPTAGATLEVRLYVYETPVATLETEVQATSSPSVPVLDQDSVSLAVLTPTPV